VISHLPEEERTGDPSFILTEHGVAQCYDLAYSDGARFVVGDDRSRIWGSFRPPLTSQDFATYFLGPVMGFLLRRRHITCLHASAVELLDRGVVFSGDAGYGKSTTAAAFALRGLPVISEDIVPLEENAGMFYAIPGYPRVCLWPDSVERLLGSAGALPLIAPGWEKRYLQLDGTRAKFSSEKLPLGLIYLFAPRTMEEGAPRLEELRPREALLRLVQNTYMNWLLDREQRAVEFDVLSRVVQQVPVRKIVPHEDPHEIGELCDLIERDAMAMFSNASTLPLLVPG
jgi:hypothetical protein